MQHNSAGKAVSGAGGPRMVVPKIPISGGVAGNQVNNNTAARGRKLQNASSTGSNR